VIVKLDRLARNVHFISGLMESKVEFVACAMPTANRLTVHILAAVAEDEARAIADRTKTALAATKARGRKLGNPDPRRAVQTVPAAGTSKCTGPSVVGWSQSLARPKPLPSCRAR
jgi:DNA invertase Pin-like site-specific DNA recombinase